MARTEALKELNAYIDGLLHMSAGRRARIQEIEGALRAGDLDALLRLNEIAPIPQELLDKWLIRFAGCDDAAIGGVQHA